MASAIKQGYDELFIRNEYAHDLSKNDLKDLVYEITGAEKGNTATECVISTFLNLKEYADFESDAIAQTETDAYEGRTDTIATSEHEDVPGQNPSDQPSNQRTFGLSYTININLPETKDVEVYNAIFEAIERKLLK